MCGGGCMVPYEIQGLGFDPSNFALFLRRVHSSWILRQPPGRPALRSPLVGLFFWLCQANPVLFRGNSAAGMVRGPMMYYSTLFCGILRLYRDNGKENMYYIVSYC